MGIFKHLEKLCEFKNRVDSPTRKKSSSKLVIPDSADQIRIKKLHDDFILQDMDQIQPDSEN